MKASRGIKVVGGIKIKIFSNLTQVLKTFRRFLESQTCTVVLPQVTDSSHRASMSTSGVWMSSWYSLWRFSDLSVSFVLVGVHTYRCLHRLRDQRGENKGSVGVWVSVCVSVCVRENRREREREVRIKETGSIAKCIDNECTQCHKNKRKDN